MVGGWGRQGASQSGGEAPVLLRGLAGLGVFSLGIEAWEGF